MNIEMEIEADVSVLLYRALYEKEIHVFGEDGLGKYGKNDHPKTFKIIDLRIDAEMNSEGDTFGDVEIVLDKYDCDDCGFIMTDRNAEISIANLLIAESIDPKCLTWKDYYFQGRSSITMRIDIPLLLDWA